MKRKSGFAVALLAIMLMLSLSGCEAGETLVKTNKTYEFVNPIYSLATVDSGINIDGKFDETFWKPENRSWLNAKKISGERTADVGVATFFGDNGVYLALTVRENTPISFLPSRTSAYNSGLELYFAFGDARTWQDGLYEIDVNVGEQFLIRKYTASGYKTMGYTRESAPVISVTRYGDVKAGTCNGYDIEVMLPYSMFGRQGKPASVFINPTLISPLDSVSSNREWYNFGEQQISFFNWSSVRQAYTFNVRGFVSETLTISATGGGTVSEEFGCDYAVIGDTVNFFVLPDEGKKLISFSVNGEDRTAEVNDSHFSTGCDGAVSVKAVFGDA